MDECSEVSQVSTEDDIASPGPLFRVKVVVLGAAQCGKSSLVQCMLHGTAHPHTVHTPTEGVRVDLWTPFKTQGLQRLLNRKLTKEEHQLVLELWDTSGRQACQPVHGLFLTARTLCVIVYDVSDGKATEKVTALYQMVQQRYVGSAVVVVGNKADLVDPSAAAAAETTTRGSLLGCDDVLRQRIVTEIEDTKALLRDCHPSNKDNDSGTRDAPLTKRGSKLSLQSSAGCSEQTVVENHLTELQQRLARAAGGARLRLVTVSAFSGKGLDDLRKTILEAAVDPFSFPHCSSTVRPSTVALYDHILALRERDVVVLPWQQFQETICWDSSDASGESFDAEDFDYLEAVGGLAQFSIGCITFPTAVASRQQDGPEEEVVTKASAQAGEATQAGELYVCVHPAVLATAICFCLIDDDKKSFKFEAGRFWPKDSGFKHPDPQLLCLVLETIPQLGMLRECLLPLLWQEYLLSEDQVLHMLHVLQGLGVLAHHSDQKQHCEGLALPHFPRLSVHRCHALPLLALLPDNRPQLNWTAKPFVGDIQVTWSFHMHVHAGLLQRLLAVVLFLCRQCSNYRHLWRTGVLLRVGEATVCAEQQGEGRFDVACRVNGDELGREAEDTRMLWVMLVPFVLHVRRFLQAWPGLHFKETVMALGQQFYLDEKVDQEPEVWLPTALSLWHRNVRMTFMEGDTEHELDVQLLFPFKPDISVVNVESWLQLVMRQTHVILSDASVTMSSSLPPETQETALKRLNMRGSVRQHRKKKSVEVKWKLQEENNNNSNKPSIASSTKSETASDPTSKGSKPAAKEDNLHTHTSTVLPSDTGADQERVSVQGRVVSVQEQQAEAMRLASGFVAAILASALADYIAQEAEGDQDGRRLVSTAQIAAARVTAEAALAVQTGDIEGAAMAVIDAVNAVKGNNPSSSKSEPKGQGSSNQSKLCAVL